MSESIQKPVIVTDEEYFVMLSHITPVNNKLVLNKSEAALVLIELMRFLDISSLNGLNNCHLKDYKEALKEVQKQIDNLKKYRCETQLAKLLEIKQNYLKLINS